MMLFVVFLIKKNWSALWRRMKNDMFPWNSILPSFLCSMRNERLSKIVSYLGYFGASRLSKYIWSFEVDLVLLKILSEFECDF